jgi:hypothetical protein
MKKEVLESFIEKYSLGKVVTKVKWKYTAAEKKLHTRGNADHRSFVVDVVMSDFTDLGGEDVVLCIGDTEKVSKMLTPFGEDIALLVNKAGERILGFSISDKDCESYCTCADPSAMDPVAKNLNEIKGFTAEIKLDKDFVDRFLKARTALNDVETFTVATNKKGVLEIVIGYSTANSNRIRIVPPTVNGLDKIDKSITFPINNVFELLKANKGLEGTLKVHPDGILHAFFKDDRYESTYYQFANKKA